MIQVFLGVLLVSAQHYKPPRFHMFYGFVVVHHRRACCTRTDTCGRRGAGWSSRTAWAGSSSWARDPRRSPGDVSDEVQACPCRAAVSCCSSEASRPSTTSRASPPSRSRARSTRPSTTSSRSAITTDGRWLLAGEARADARRRARDALPAAFAVEGDLAAACRARRRRQATDVDVVIPLLHGPYGEDGTVQGLLELAACPTSARACSVPRSRWTRSR